MTIVLATVAFLLSFGITLRFSVTPSKRLAALAREAIEKLVSLPVVVEDAWIEAASTSLVLANVRIGEDPEKPEILIPRVRVEPTYRWKEGFTVTRVVVDRPEVRASAFLARPTPLLRPTGEASSAPLPTIVVQDGTVELPFEPVGILHFNALDLAVRALDADEIAISGSVRTPLQAILRVGGSANRATGRLDIRAEADPPADLAKLPREGLDPEVLRWRDALEPSGRFTVYAHLLREDSRSPMRVEGQLEATGVSFSSPVLAIAGKSIDLRAVSPTDFKVEARLDTDGMARASVEGRVFGGAKLALLGEARLDVATGDVSQARLGARARGLILGPNVERILESIDHDVADVYRGLHPEGPVDVSVAVEQGPPGGPPNLAAEIDLTSDTRIAWLGFADTKGEVDASFPYQLTDLAGRISIRPGRVWLAGVRGKFGSARVGCLGEVWGGGQVGLDLAIDGFDLPLDETTQTAIRGIPTDPAFAEALRADPAWRPIGLSEGIAALGLFDLRGKLGFGATVTRPQGRSRADVLVRVTADGGASGTFRELPIPVEGLRGNVAFEGGNARFAIEGQTLGGTVAIRGEIDGAAAAGGATSRPGLRLRVDGRALEVSPTAVDALRVSTPSAANLLADMDVRGKLDLAYRGERPRNATHESLDAALAFELSGGVVQRVPFVGIGLDEVGVSARVTLESAGAKGANATLHLDSVRARYFGRPILGVGRIRVPEGEEISSEIDAFGSGLPFRGELLQSALAQISPEAAAAVARYSFGGSFDAQIALRRTAASNSISVEAALRDAALSGPGVPGDLDGFSGKVVIDGSGQVRGEMLRGRLEGIPISFEDFRIDPPAGAKPLLLSARASTKEPIDAVNALVRSNPDAKDWARSLALALSASAERFDFTVAIPEDAPVSFSASGDVDIWDGSVTADQLVRELRGKLAIRELTYDEAGFHLLADASGGSFDYWHFPVSDFGGTLEITSADLTVRDASASILGGRAAPRHANEPLLSVGFGEGSPRWQLEAALSRASLREVFRPFPGAGGAIEGRLAGDLSVEGLGADLRSFRGAGRVRVEDGTLFEVPGFRAVYDGLQLEKKPVFHEMVGSFRVDRGLVRFDRLDLRSDPLDLKGDGWVSLDGRINMTFFPRPHGLIPLVLTGFGILEPLQDRLVDVSVFGTIDRTQHKINMPFSKKTTLRKQVIAPAPPLDLGVLP